MAAYYHKPELALRRALELRGINQDGPALVILNDVLSNRRPRIWSPIYEKIMMSYLDLCLSLRLSRQAKDGLHQYRTLSQTQAPGSLEKVIRYLLDQAEAQCAAAKAVVDAEAAASNVTRRADLLVTDNAAAAANAAANADIAIDGAGDDDGGGVGNVVTGDEDDDDDDAAGGFGGASPQAILLTTMSTDPAKSQRDSTLLLPALKFLWETYRAVLDILRSNSKLEHVYHGAAEAALKFCRSYQRRMEFRHLCEMLRTHLGNLRQYGNANVAENEDTSKTNYKVWLSRRKDYDLIFVFRFLLLFAVISFFYFFHGLIFAHCVRCEVGKVGHRIRLICIYTLDLCNLTLPVPYVGIRKGFAQ
jgi:translation initiation factor 3 subunit A